MGNNNSTMCNIENKKCLICLEDFDSQKWSKCIRCNILLHNICEKTYRGQKGYCKCPHCQRIGTIVFI